jgi:regulator of protease activity HflC (stomatin/prohibitin superfamily)
MWEAMIRESESERVRKAAFAEAEANQQAVIAEVEGRRQATLIQAEAEDQAAEQLLHAARTIAEDPSGLQLRTIQAVQEMTSGKSTVVLLAVPMDFVKSFVGMSKSTSSTA